MSKERDKYLNIKSAYNNKPMIWSDRLFWNPAEIIGTNPKPLVFSLYKEIITSQAWNEGLISMGYKKTPHNLMQNFGNKPFISLEYSFRSLNPEALNEDLTNKLISFYSDKLRKNLKSHDKLNLK